MCDFIDDVGVTAMTLSSRLYPFYVCVFIFSCSLAVAKFAQTV